MERKPKPKDIFDDAGVLLQFGEKKAHFSVFPIILGSLPISGPDKHIWAGPDPILAIIFQPGTPRRKKMVVSSGFDEANLCKHKKRKCLEITRNIHFLYIVVLGFQAVMRSIYTSLTICHPQKKLFKSSVESDNQNKSQEQTTRVTQTTYHISIERSGRGWNVGFPQPCWTTLILDSWVWKCVNQFQLRHVITKIEHSKTSHISKNNDVPQTNQNLQLQYIYLVNVSQEIV